MTLRTSSGKYVSAEGGGGDVVCANRDPLGPWEQFDRQILGAVDEVRGFR